MSDLKKLSDAATQGPWRVYTSIEVDDKDRTKITDQRWGIAAGKREGPHQNKGHFHPSNAEYYLDELHVVEISSDRDYGYPEGACEKPEDAEFIAALVNAYRAGELVPKALAEGAPFICQWCGRDTRKVDTACHNCPAESPSGPEPRRD